MKFNTFQIKNFKSFGAKAQTIKEKPLTLVYGKNSIGKSSLMQGMLLFDYFKLAPLISKGHQFFSVKTSYFAGDALHFGKFENYVYKKDTGNEVVFKRTIEDKNEIHHLLFGDDENFNYFLEKDLFSYIEEQLPQYDNSPMQLFKTVFEGIKSSIDKEALKEKGKSIGELKILDFIEYFSFKGNLSKQDEVLFQYLYFYGVSFGEKLDIDEFVKFHLKIAKIKKIEYSLIVSSKKTQDAIINIRLDDEDFLTISDKCKRTFFGISELKHKIDFSFHEQSDFVKILSCNKSNFSLNKLYIAMLNLIFQTELARTLDCESLATFFWSRFFNMHYQIKKPQFIGPLRSIPDKKELKYMQRSREKKDKFYDLESFYKKISNNSRIDKEYGLFGKFPFKSKPIFTTLKIVILLVVLLLIVPLLVFLPLFIVYVLFKMPAAFPELTVILNKILPKKLKVSSYDAKTNEKMWRVLFDDSETLSKVNHWLSTHKSYTPYRISFKKQTQGILQRIFRKKLRWQLVFEDLRNNTFVMPKDMGAGISQFLPLLLSCIANKNTKLFIEQPELHLHPSMQGDLADEMIKSCKTNNNMIFAETHSEHILLRIMKRMRETSEGTLKDNELHLTPEDVAILYIDADEKRGTYITELELSEDGNLLDPWPGGFFEEGFEERFF